MFNDITTNLDATSPLISSVKIENNEMTIKGQNLNAIKSFSIDVDGSEKMLLIQDKTAAEVKLIATEATQLPYGDNVTFKIQTSEGESSQMVPIVVPKGSIAVSKLEAGSDGDYLVTDGDGVVKWQSASLLTELQATDLQVGSLTGGSVLLNTSPLQLTGSILSIDGSRLVGAGTAFTSQLQKNDTVLVGGKVVKVKRVMSDTEFIAKDPIQFLKHDKGYPEIEGIYFSDDRSSEVSSTTLRIPLPQQAYPNWVVLVGGFTKRAGTSVNRTLTWNGSTVIVTATQDQDPLMADLWVVKGSASSDTSYADLSFTGTQAGNMSLIAVVLTSASQVASQEKHNGTGVASVEDSFSIASGQRGFIIAMTDDDMHPAKGSGTARMELPFMVGSKRTAPEYSVGVFSTGFGDYGTSTYSIPFLEGATPAHIFFEVHVDGGASMKMVRYRGGKP
jgi:hypothetical protein